MSSPDSSPDKALCLVGRELKTAPPSAGRFCLLLLTGKILELLARFGKGKGAKRAYLTFIKAYFKNQGHHLRMI